MLVRIGNITQSAYRKTSGFVQPKRIYINGVSQCGQEIKKMGRALSSHFEIRIKFATHPGVAGRLSVNRFSPQPSSLHQRKYRKQKMKRKTTGQKNTFIFLRRAVNESIWQVKGR
jgi:hypothetical protein